MKISEKIIQNGLTDPDLHADILELEGIIDSLQSEAKHIADPPAITINPTVRPYRAKRKGLKDLFFNPDDTPLTTLEKREELLLIWWDPKGAQVRMEPASEENLLVLKMVEDGLDPKEVARIGNLPLGAVDGAIEKAVRKGLLLRPKSKIRRDERYFVPTPGIEEEVITAEVFTLQWHITQQCDLHCKHCYDRSKRSPLTLEQAYEVLEQLRDFCREKSVSGQISLSGGNPLLYPHFLEIYKMAADYGFVVSILGNPTSRKQMEDILAIQTPDFYQVSLEGLREHNDAIRGKGHFDRTMEFLELLKDLGIYSMVMLTLTNDNLSHVLPLAKMLKDKVDLFTFNRLSMVGEGANLSLPSPDQYRDFLSNYLSASRDNPALALKDNLFNIELVKKGKKLIGGCTGYGCGAAFNFLALLPDGEVHACRKFPSFLGNIHQQSLIEIYDSELAQRYRRGPEACADCDLRCVCRGCLAVSHGFGLNIFAEKDPFCYM